MEDCCAPQWVDFTKSCSPQVPMQDYFEKEHLIHEPIPDFSDHASEVAQHVSTDILCTNKEAQEDLNVIKNTPIKVISPNSHNKKAVIEQLTYDQVLSDAIKKLDLCNKSSKARVALNKSVQEANIFKTPNISTKCKSIGFQSVPNKFAEFTTAKINKDVYVPDKNDNTFIPMEKASIRHTIFKENEVCTNNDNLENSIDASGNKENNEEFNKENNKISLHDKLEELMDDNGDNNDDKYDIVHAKTKISSRMQFDKQRQTNRTTVLTWRNGQRNLNKRRLSNPYISLAEAVSRFQNETPKRFRTKSNKNLTGGVSHNISKLLTQRLKPTIPVSPALVSKNRKRMVTALSQEERELEEMKKYQIKAKPIPSNILRTRHATSKVATAKKPTTSTVTTVMEFPSTQQSEKDLTSALALPKSLKTSHRALSPKNTVTQVLVADPTGIIVKREKIAFFGIPTNTASAKKSATRVIPFSFEARNKDLQMKKEQRLKSLQENKTENKTEFHAKPAPNFSKSSTIKQQQDEKKLVHPCPFSFDKRDKNLLKKKEALAKQILEEEKRLGVFRANPAPVFKPVIVHGKSKNRLSTKEKMIKEHVINKCDNQENEEPNIVVAAENKQENKHMRKTKNMSYITTEKRSITSLKNKEREVIVPIELNTDKRARERREFDEKIKRKEMEEEAKRQEENRKRLEQEKQMKAELRKLAEVKARPMPTYKALPIIKMTKPLTNPQSPTFANKHKSKQT